MKVWKVVNSKLQSCIVERGALIQYGIGVWSKPPDILAKNGYYITCFKTKKDADSFISATLTYSKDFVIFQAEAKHIIYDTYPPRLDAGEVSAGNLSLIIWQTTIWPKGTLMCKELMLIRPIKGSEK